MDPKKIMFSNRKSDSKGVGLITQTGAKTMGIDAKTKKIFLPAAEYDMKPNADPAKPPVRTMKPGSFVLLVVSR